MGDLLQREDLLLLKKRLGEIDKSLPSALELESLIPYPFVRAELGRRGLEYGNRIGHHGR